MPKLHLNFRYKNIHPSKGCSVTQFSSFIEILEVCTIYEVVQKSSLSSGFHAILYLSLSAALSGKDKLSFLSKMALKLQ